MGLSPTSQVVTPTGFEPVSTARKAVVLGQARRRGHGAGSPAVSYRAAANAVKSLDEGGGLSARPEGVQADAEGAGAADAAASSSSGMTWATEATLSFAPSRMIRTPWAARPVERMSLTGQRTICPC